MGVDELERISVGLYNGLYALLGEYDVSREEAVESLRRAIWTINDETGIDAGNRLLAGNDTG